MVLIVSLVLSMLGAAEPGVSVANFQRLSVGMPEWEVARILGRPGDSIGRVTGSYFKGWEGTDGLVVLEFSEGDRRLYEGQHQDALGKQHEVPRCATATAKMLNCLAIPWRCEGDGTLTDTPGVTRENFKRLACGMTIRQVERLFGTPGTPYPLATSSDGMTWDGEDISVRLQFDQGRLIQGSYWDYPKRHRVYLQ